MTEARSSPRAIVLGAGPAGLAVAACLTKAGVPHVQIDEADRVGARWHRHYDRLHLHTVRRFSSLPGYAMPNDWPKYVPREKFAAYLGDYAAFHGLRPRLGVRATRATREGERWRLETTEGPLEARCLIVATGYNRRAVIPPIPGTFSGEVLHSGAYKNGRPYRGKHVLVVGAGNSGAEIALDLWEHGATASMSIRGPLHVTPRDLLGRPAQETAHLMAKLPPKVADRLSLLVLGLAVGDLTPYGISRPELGPVSQVLQKGRVPLIDVGTVALIKQRKIVVYPGVRAAEGRTVEFVDGRRIDVDAIVLATGYRAALDELFPDAAALTNERGYPRWHGEEAPAGDLWFVGFRNPLTGALHDIGREAERVARAVAARPA